MQKESRCRKVEGLRVVKTIEKKKKRTYYQGWDIIVPYLQTNKLSYDTFLDVGEQI